MFGHEFWVCVNVYFCYRYAHAEHIPTEILKVFGVC